VLTAAISAFVALVVAALSIRFDVLQFLEPPSIHEQLEEIQVEMAKDGRFIPVLRRISLHGSGIRSYLIVTRDRTHLENPWTGELEADEIRIYDLVDGELTLAFAFQPRLHLQGEGPRSRLVFEPTSIVDLNGDGAAEVFGAFYGFFMEPLFPRPIVIGWDPATSTL
jgi:hypothetical protein